MRQSPLLDVTCFFVGIMVIGLGWREPDLLAARLDLITGGVLTGAAIMGSMPWLARWLRG